MRRFHPLFSALASLILIPTLLLAQETERVSENDTGEIVYGDSLKIFYRKRNAHGCIMCIVFLIIFPLGAISMHLPLPASFRRINFHVPIQILGLVMMIGAMGLGIDLAHNDLRFFASARSVPAHVIIGLLATSMIILIQPALGILQHRHFLKTGGKSIFGYIHRWNGRTAIILGFINQGLGFQLVGIGRVVKPHSLIRNFVFLGVLGGLWLMLVQWDWIKGEMSKRKAAENKSDSGKEEMGKTSGTSDLMS